MQRKSLALRAFGALVILLSTIVLFGFAEQDNNRLRAPALALKTSSERRATLNAFRAAWENRPSAPTPTHARAEKDFINRTAVFLDRCDGREIQRDAFLFYKQTVTDFFARYESEEILGQR